MEQMLIKAAQSGDINALYESLRQDPTLLDKHDEASFADTPAHIAAAAGSTHFAIEVLSLKPSFGMKLNPDGYSPLDLALRHGKARTVKRLIEHYTALIRVRGREGFMPLHYAAQVGDADLLADLLVACPESIQDLTIRGETAVHIAIKNLKVRALQVLLGWLKREKNEKILNWKDENGDTALHIAASTNNLEIVTLLINRVKIINAQNLEGLTCLDTFMRLPIAGDERIAKAFCGAGAERSSSLHPVDTLADILSSKESFTRKVLRQVVELDAGLDDLSSEMRNALLVVAVLFATATYQAALCPPGGISSGGDTILLSNNSCNISFSSISASNSTTIYTSNTTGKVQMNECNFIVFVLLNTIVFVASGRIIFRLLPTTLSHFMLFVGLALSLNYRISIVIIAPILYPLQSYVVLGIVIICLLILFLTVLFSAKQAFHQRRYLLLKKKV